VCFIGRCCAIISFSGKIVPATKDRTLFFNSFYLRKYGLTVLGDTSFIYLSDRNEHMKVLAREEFCVKQALLYGEGCYPSGISGRGEVSFFPLADGGEGVLRRCRRGGLIQFFLHNRYLFINRPLLEFEVHAEAQRRRLPVPLLLGVKWRQQGCTFSGVLATRRMEGQDLDAWLCTAENPAEKHPEILHACGVMIRTCHDAGLFHADLNIKNIFIEKGCPRLLDFDRACFYNALGDGQRARNLLRLRRSFEKKGHSREDFEMLLQGYGSVNIPRWLQLLSLIKNSISDLFQRKRKIS
jgi:3-deoxy-D-manno-octulosonic acid kinase